MKKYNLDELRIVKDQENSIHLCTVESHFLNKDTSLYKQSKAIASPIGYHQYIDIFDNSTVQITDVYSEVIDYFVHKRKNDKFLFFLKQNSISTSTTEECTIEELEHLWKQVQEIETKGFQKRLKLK